MAHSHTLDTVFHAAADWLAASPSAATLSNDTKLQIYGIYKLVTLGPPPPNSTPPFFSLPTTKAKHSSWVSTTNQYQNNIDDARRKYIDIAINIGFNEEIVSDVRTAGVGGGTVSVIKNEDGDDDEEEREEIINAAMNNNPTHLVELLEQDPTLLNYQDSEKMTPLHYAADRGHLSILQILIDRGADQTIKDVDDMTPYDVAMINGRIEILELFNQKVGQVDGGAH